MKRMHFLLVFALVPPVPLSAADRIQFNRDIRPILSDKCFACHGPDKNRREADLRLDTETGLLGEAGEPGAVVPGRLDDSELFLRVTSEDPDERMPPESSGKELTPEQVDSIRVWIENGAVWEGHWSFQPLGRPSPPAVEAQAFVKNEIDAFILRALREQGLTPSPAADPAALVRRLSFDLRGLPPTTEEVTAFVNDPSDQSYASIVQRFLDSPAHAERMAMWWLDLVRYADTVGYHGDQPVSVFPFRDYVIQSFMGNKPFDEFTLEQLAGDLLAEPTIEQQVASGYNRLGMMSAEGGVQDKEYLAKYIAERVRNLGGAWLGVTLQCCECHDHKYDPFTMRDFYSLEAFFADISERGLYAGAHASGDWGPKIQVPTSDQKRQLDEFDAQIAAAKQTLETPTAELADLQAEWEEASIRWILLQPDQLTALETTALETTVPPTAKDGSTAALGRTLGREIDHLEQDSVPARHVPSHFPLPAENAPPPIHSPETPPPAIAAALVKPAWRRAEDEQRELAAYYRSIAPPLDGKRVELQELEKNRETLNRQIPTTLVTVAVAPRAIRLLARGNWMDESGPVMQPAFPAVLSAPAGADPGRLTRLNLAHWLTSPEHPLTARTFVNRQWKLFFGAGLSRRVDDLGAQGEQPSHPELLDWLAHRFVDSGWNIRELVRLLVLSGTYRQSSQETAELRERDPSNRWLARQARFRLDAEMVRDNALAVSGLLVTQVGGPSVKPYQPPGYWAYLNFPMREWQNGTGDELYRRGLYTHWQRQYLHPALLAFDAPSREECTADRPRSNTPLQSLVLLNDPSYVEAARAFAEQILRQGGSTAEERVAWALRRTLSRPGRPDEQKVLIDLVAGHLDEYRQDQQAAGELLSVGVRPPPDDLEKAELAAWTSAARALLCLHETNYRD